MRLTCAASSAYRPHTCEYNPARRPSPEQTIEARVRVETSLTAVDRPPSSAQPRLTHWHSNSEGL